MQEFAHLLCECRNRFYAIEDLTPLHQTGACLNYGRLQLSLTLTVLPDAGRNSRRRKYRKVVKERPDLAPSALFHLIGNSVFLRLSDVASGLPDYEEQVMLTAMDPDTDATGFSQKSAYEKLFEKLRHAMVKALADGSRRLLSTYLQSLLAYPDGCTRGETVFDPASGEPLIQVPPLAEDRVYPKEKALLDLVAAERLAGRRVLVYATHTGTRDITGRMDDMLTRHGFKVAVMKADSVAPERREAWVAEKVKQGVDVIICHPRLVQTGLDLVDFPTIVWYETDYSVYTMRQASRRSWRIGQTRPVKVIFMAYRNTLQADALKLVAKKLQSSLAVEGELPEDGLAAYGDDGDDLMLALARKLVNGNEDNAADTVEAAFAHARATETESEEYLVDEGWKATEPVMPAIVENRSAKETEYPLHAAANAEPDTTAPQQTLFSWSEFMAEPTLKSKGRARNTQPSLSLFEWAVAMEEAQEEERVAVPA